MGIMLFLTLSVRYPEEGRGPADASEIELNEYFCFEGDDLWTSSQEQLIDLGKRELATLGLADPGDVIDAAVVRMKKAYPVYDRGYDGAVAKVRAFLAALPNLQLVGRNGMHRYNNQAWFAISPARGVRKAAGLGQTAAQPL